jgi:hypothetical protein
LPPLDLSHAKPELVRRYAETPLNQSLYGKVVLSGSNDDGPAADTDVELIARALDMWANWIETGDVSLSGNDANAMRKKVRAVGKDGMKLVLRLRQLAEDTSNYEQFKRGLTNAPMSFCPALLKAMVETCYAKHAFRPGQIHHFVKQIEDQCELNSRTTPEPP